MDLALTYFDICASLKEFFNNPRKPPAFLFSVEKGFFQKPNANGMVLGLSGGLDSALVAAIAVDAIGSDKVKALFIPGEHTRPESEELAFSYANKLCIEITKIRLDPTIPRWLRDDVGENYEVSIPVQNYIARKRAIVIRSYAEVKNLLVLSTLNRSEVLLGYFALGADNGGDYGPIIHQSKTMVRNLAEWRDIPKAILARSPSAELFLGQTDEDDLGCSYEDVDYYIDLTSEKPVGFKFNQELQDRLKDLVKKNSFKEYLTRHLKGD